jgi:hypothetical protein
VQSLGGAFFHFLEGQADRWASLIPRGVQRQDRSVPVPAGQPGPELPGRVGLHVRCDRL